jgi:hypothetical protein
MAESGKLMKNRRVNLRKNGCSDDIFLDILASWTVRREGNRNAQRIYSADDHDPQRYNSVTDGASPWVMEWTSDPV